MKTRAAFALLLAFGVQAEAQLGGMSAPASPARGQQQSALTPENQGQLELLELEQEADKALLKEALLLVGRKELNATLDLPADKEVEKRDAEQREVRAFIAEKKDSILKRSAEMKTLRDEPMRMLRAQAASQVDRRRAQMTDGEKQRQIEMMETSQAETQLLQRQVQIFQNGLTEAIEALANAEFLADNDASQKEKAEAAKRKYEKAKARFVEVSKRAQIEQQRYNDLQHQVGMGGMGGGMGGMGGGFR